MHFSTLHKIFAPLFVLALIAACQKSNSQINGRTPQRSDTTVTETKPPPPKQDTAVAIGNSIIAGHPAKYSALELNAQNWPDSPGQITYYLTQLTGVKWVNQGWGGQTTVQIRNRFLRDAIGLTYNPGDGRGSRTLPGTPTYIVIEGGVNDIQQRIPLATIEGNLAWMASTCKQYKIPCIVLNCVGQGNGVFVKDQLDNVAALNQWLAAGALDSVNVTVVDINSIWNSGTLGGVSSYNNDNFHYSSLVDSVDGIHFTPAGYDSVANAIFRVAKLPPSQTTQLPNAVRIKQ
jgi:lysophospholipase L1-like esterase